MCISRVICTAFALGLSIRPSAVEAQAQAPAPIQDPALAQALRAEIEQLRKDFEARLAALEAASRRPGNHRLRHPPAPFTPSPPTAEVPAGAEGAGGPAARCRCTAERVRRVEDLQPRHRGHRQLPRRRRQERRRTRSRRCRCTNRKPRSRRSSIRTRAPTSSSRSARKASSSRRASSRFPRCPAAC